MNSKVSTALQPRQRHLAGAAAALALTVLLGLPGLARAQVPFAKPELAADALIDALASNDEAALARVLGKGWRQLLSLQDADIHDRYAFLAKASQVRQATLKDGRGFLDVGSDPFTLPAPMVQGQDGQWRFDPAAGREEMATRRIGANERAAMQVMQAYVDAQLDYALADRNADGVLEHAQKLLSRPGKRDGLIWSTQLGDESPLGEDVVPAKPGQGYHGYRFRILKGQGSAAPGSARSYLIGPGMVSGYALVAWPVAYGRTGVMSFIVNQSGLVFERNLGPQTTAAAAAIQRFNPDAGWQPARPWTAAR